MVVAPFLLAVLSQAPAQGAAQNELAVLVSRRLGVSEVRAQGLARKVVEHLKEQGFDRVPEPAQSAKALAVLGVEDSAACEGKRECVAGLGRVLRAWGVLSMDLADIDGTMAIHFELLESDTGTQLAVQDVALPSKKVEVELVGQLKPLVAAVQAAAPPPAEPPAPKAEPRPQARQPPGDAPVAAKLEPQQPVAQLEPAPRLSKARVGAIVTTSATVVGGALVILFLSQAGNARRQLDLARVDRNGVVAYNLPEAQARALGGQVNDNYAAALGVGIGTAALAITSGVLWAQP